jgi:SAM-dependent methyltransferase
MATRRSAVLAALNLRSGERVLEVGCGGGFYASEAARCVGSEGGVCAIDISEDQIQVARERCREFPWVQCNIEDVTSLPYEDSEFDACYGVQVLEYLSNLEQALRELHRVLRPGGRILILATNWSSVVWNSEWSDRMKKVLEGWGQHAPIPDLPVMLPFKMREAGLRPIHQVAVPVLNMSYNENAFSYWAARMIKGFVVGRKVLSETEADAWLGEFDELERKGAYFFCSTPILTEAVKVN